MMKAKWILVLILVTAFLFSGCSKSSSQAAGPTKNNAEMSLQDSQLSVEGENSNRKMIVSVTFQVETTDFSNAAEALNQEVSSSGGYLESLQQRGSTESNGSGTYVLRIPVTEINTFADALKQIGTITNRSQSTEDITDQYYDVDSRLKAKKTQRDRILALMEKAEALSDLLQLEQELAGIQTEIDQLTGQQQRYDNQVEYATITVELWQTVLTESSNTPFAPQVAKAFRDSFAVAFKIVQGIGIALIWILPYLLTAGVVLVIVHFATRKKRRARKAEKAPRPYQPMVQPPVSPVMQPKPPVSAQEKAQQDDSNLPKA